MKKTLILALILALTILASACEAKTTKYKVDAVWYCSAPNTYTVQITNNHPTEAWDMRTQADSYIVLLVPGMTETQTHPLPRSGRPWVQVYGTGTDNQIVMPTKPMVCK